MILKKLKNSMKLYMINEYPKHKIKSQKLYRTKAFYTFILFIYKIQLLLKFSLK